MKKIIDGKYVDVKVSVVDYCEGAMYRLRAVIDGEVYGLNIPLLLQGHKLRRGYCYDFAIARFIEETEKLLFKRKPMSYSFSYKGSIADVRSCLAEQFLNQCGCRGGRAAAALIGSELDVIEAEGGTHATVYAGGSPANHSITVRRDHSAELSHREELTAAAFDSFLQDGAEKGFFAAGVNGVPTLLVPERSKVITKLKETKGNGQGSCSAQYDTAKDDNGAGDSFGPSHFYGGVTGRPTNRTVGSTS